MARQLEALKEYISSNVFHAFAVPLLFVTVGLAYAARPSTSENMPAGFRPFMFKFLVAWSFSVAADWFQGPFLYDIHAAYLGHGSPRINQLFGVTFAASLVFGGFIGHFVDKFGRKRACLAYCVCNVLRSMTVHFNSLPVLVVGRMMGGVASLLLFSSFECWMVSEHFKQGFSGGLLNFMFGMMFTVYYAVGILVGLLGEFLVPKGDLTACTECIHCGGACVAFDYSALCSLLGFFLIAHLFGENYGSSDGSQSSLMVSLRSALMLFVRDKRILLVGVTVSLLEAAMFTFIVKWVPSLRALSPQGAQIPVSLVFAMFMMACMCGSSTSTLLGHVPPVRRLFGSAAGSCLAFALCGAAVERGSLPLLLLSFLFFEFSIGVYFPSAGAVKSEIVPENMRGMVYNIYRVPLNALVALLLLGNLEKNTDFRINTALGFVAMIATLYLVRYARRARQTASKRELVVAGVEVTTLNAANNNV